MKRACTIQLPDPRSATDLLAHATYMASRMGRRCEILRGWYALSISERCFKVASLNMSKVVSYKSDLSSATWGELFFHYLAAFE